MQAGRLTTVNALAAAHRNSPARTGLTHPNAFTGYPAGRRLPRIRLDATATLEERDTGKRGQPVHQLVLESRVTGF